MAATRQHVGKTSVSLALVSGLQKRFDQVGFMKPVGQQSIILKDPTTGGIISVDRDVVCLRERFRLSHLSLKSMSPLLIPDGYTRDFLDGKIVDTQHESLIQQAYRNIRDRSSVVLCEGTGHSAVGSIVEASNAAVASWLGANMVLVANGGLGMPFDELELNRALCQRHGVPIAGVIINKVKKSKYDQTKHYFQKALRHHWDDVPLLGCIPDRVYLGCPALGDLEKLFQSSLLSGQQHRLRHYTVRDIQLVSGSRSVFQEYMNHELETAPRTLYVCHSSRDDILETFLHEHSNDPSRESALIMCDSKRFHQDQLDKLAQNGKEANNPAIMVVSTTTTGTMKELHSYTPKLNIDDFSRIDWTVDHYEPYIDFDLLLERTNNGKNRGGDHGAPMARVAGE